MPEVAAAPVQTSTTPPPDTSGIPDKIFEGKAPVRKGLADYVKTGAPPKPEPKPVDKPAETEPEDPAVTAAPFPDELFSEVPKPNGDANPVEKPDEKPAEKKDEAKKDEPAPAKPQEPVQPETPAPKQTGGQLRAGFEAALKENKQLKAKVEELERLAETGKEAETWKAKATEADQKLRYVDYQSSAEFREKYEEPLQKAINTGIKVVARAKNKQAERPGNADDVFKLSKLYANDLEGAVEAAEEMFGKAAPEVLAAARAISEANEAASEALESWKKEAPKRVEMTLAQQREALGKTRQVYESHSDEFTRARPDVFDFSDEPELEAIRNNYSKKVDGAFFPEEGVDQQTLVRRSATVRALASAAIPLAVRYRKSQDEIATLKKQLAEFEDSAPKVIPSGDGGKSSQKPKGFLDGLREKLSERR